MAKPYRKAKRRPSSERATQLDAAKQDADLDELFEVLKEKAGDRLFASWEVPWRDGINAVQLALEAARTAHSIDKRSSPRSLASLEALELLRRMIVEDESGWRGDSMTYYQLEDLQKPLKHALAGGDLIRRALRMMQLRIANSHGGGHGYNAILSSVEWHQLPNYQSMIRRWRCQDVTDYLPEAEIDSDLTPLIRRRRAFLTAWDRGMYAIAYTI